jgi:hypothetical protein
VRHCGPAPCAVERAVAGPLDDAAMVHSDGQVDQIAAQRSEPGEDAIFVRARKPRIADNVGDKDRANIRVLPTAD